MLTVYNQSSIAGAIVIDTVLNANVSEGSQILSESMKRLRGMAEAITNNKYRGDFINVVKRKGHGDDLLAGVFSKHWSRADGRFKAIEAELEFSSQVPSMKELERDIDFLRSDHSRFWVANHPRYQSLPAILLTDTGKRSNNDFHSKRKHETRNSTVTETDFHSKVSDVVLISPFFTIVDLSGLFKWFFRLYRTTLGIYT